MSFFSQLRDEVNDRNIDKEKMAKLTKDLSEDKPQEEEQTQQPETDPEYPEHPEYIALKPRFTEVQLWRMPAIRFYCTIIFFCLGMIVYGVVNQVFDLGLTKGAVGWYQIFGGAIGFLFSREYLEPHWRIPFDKGTPEQKKKAVEEYLAQMDALDAHIQELRHRRGSDQDDQK